MTVSVGAVWDRAVDVLRGRAGILAPIAVATVFLPNVASGAVSQYLILPDVSASPSAMGSGPAMLTLAVSAIVLAISMWGQLAMLAISTHPATTRSDASHQATQRLLPAIGVVLLIGLVSALALLPPVLAVVQGGAKITSPSDFAAVAPGVAGFVTIYFIALMIAILWCAARLLLLNAVILNERRGLGAVVRSVRLTRGMTWKLLAVLVLFVLVTVVAASAVQLVLGLPLRLILGADALPTINFLAGIGASAVTTVFTVIAAAFTAQLYVATSGEGGAG